MLLNSLQLLQAQRSFPLKMRPFTALLMVLRHWAPSTRQSPRTLGASETLQPPMASFASLTIHAFPLNEKHLQAPSFEIIQGPEVPDRREIPSLAFSSSSHARTFMLVPGRHSIVASQRFKRGLVYVLWREDLTPSAPSRPCSGRVSRTHLYHTGAFNCRSLTPPSFPPCLLYS